jgi:hypothetical protein
MKRLTCWRVSLAGVSAAMKACAFVFSLASTVIACPLCHTETAAKIRASLVGPDLLFNVMATFLPFAVFGMITTFLYFGPARMVQIIKSRTLV